MTAFIPFVPTGSFTARGVSGNALIQARRNRPATRMAVDLEGPEFSKYLSMIPQDRVNKAPVITIDTYPNPDFNKISVRMVDFRADQGAGDSLKAGVVFDDEMPPPAEKYAKYYDPATLNEAPVITMYSDADGMSFDKHAVCVVQTVVPTRLREAACLLEAEKQNEIPALPAEN